MVLRIAAASLLLTTAAWAQPAQIGNTYDGTHHQPTAGVQSNERAAGVAPSSPQSQQENTDLSRMNAQLQNKAHTDAPLAPAADSNSVGTKPGGVVVTH